MLKEKVKYLKKFLLDGHTKFFDIFVRGNTQKVKMKKLESLEAVYTHKSNLVNQGTIIVRCLIYVNKIIKTLKNENIEEKAICFSRS